MAEVEDGYYELQVLDRTGWSLRNRYPTSADDPMVVMRARAEAEQVTHEPDVRGVELVLEYMDAKTSEVRREAVFTWGSARATPSGAPASTVASRRNILRTARAEGRTRMTHGRPAARPASAAPPDLAAPKVEPDDAPVASARAPRSAARPWWRVGAVIGLGSVALAAAATTVIWIGLSHQIQTASSLDPQPAQAGLFTVILLF